jgi:hypothetical protein
MKAIILSLLLLSLGLPGAVLSQASLRIDPQRDPRVEQLETVLNKVQEEQQSVYQQFQMTQELRRNEIQEGNPLIVQGSTDMGGVRNAPPTNYDDNIRLQRERQERVQQYTRDLNSLYARYSELGEQKRALIDRLMEITREAER